MDAKKMMYNSFKNINYEIFADKSYIYIGFGIK